MSPHYAGGTNLVKRMAYNAITGESKAKICNFTIFEILFYFFVGKIA